MPMPELSIIIVSFNTRPELEACLASIVEHAPRVSHEIVVVDNASSDQSADAVRTRWPAVRLVEAGRNAGFAAGNNIGIRSSAGELLLLLNSDTLVKPGALDTLVSELRHSPEVAAVGPRIVDAAGSPELSFGRHIAPLAEARQKLLTRLHERGVGVARRRVERLTTTRQHPDWISGACLMVRREDALAVGLLDERYFLYAEDVDFCAALRARGRRILFVPTAEIVHLRGRARRSRPVESEHAYRRAHLAFYAKHHPGWYWCLAAYLRVRGKLPPVVNR
ncbi:MAG: glycosyltransferase family 2 protein [Acidobacteriota bacterium]